MIEKSFRELGAGRSILLDKNNRIIAGNKSQQAAIATGITKVRIVDTDGDEIVAVRRRDVDLDSKVGRELAFADNATQQVSLAWDEAELQQAAIAAGIKRVRVIETTGDELVAVKRTDVDIDSADGRRMAYLDIRAPFTQGGGLRRGCGIAA